MGINSVAISHNLIYLVGFQIMKFQVVLSEGKRNGFTCFAKLILTGVLGELASLACKCLCGKVWGKG